MKRGARHELCRRDWNWEEAIRIASDETVLPALHSQVEKLGLTPELGLDVSNFLSAYTELNAQRNRQILRELEAHALLLNQAGIEPVVLKGLAYLLTGVYANPAHRFILDIDLLIPASQIESAFELLREEGYTPEIRDPTALVAHHYPPLVCPDRIKVELHHRLGPDNCQQLLPHEEVISHSVRYKLGSATVRLPAPEHLMIHLILHSQIQHGYEERIWPPLRAQYDLFLLQRQMGERIDWPSILDRFRRNRKSGLLKLHLLCVERVLGMPSPFPIHLGGLTALRWFRRQALWKGPWLRFVDPIYILSTVVLPKLRLSYHLLKLPAGRHYVLETPFRATFYRKLITALHR